MDPSDQTSNSAIMEGKRVTKIWISLELIDRLLQKLIIYKLNYEFYTYIKKFCM